MFKAAAEQGDAKAISLLAQRGLKVEPTTSNGDQPGDQSGFALGQSAATSPLTRAGAATADADELVASPASQRSADSSRQESSMAVFAQQQQLPPPPPGGPAEQGGSVRRPPCQLS